MIVQRFRTPRAADIVARPKETGNGWHYGRLVEAANVLTPEQMAAAGYPEFIVPHTMPAQGKHLGTIEEFGSGSPVQWIPQEFETEEQRRAREQQALNNLGQPYTPFANCEDDALGFSQTRDRVIKVGLLFGVGALVLKALADMD